MFTDNCLNLPPTLKEENAELQISSSSSETLFAAAPTLTLEEGIRE
jgi:hypothetical protein